MIKTYPINVTEGTVNIIYFYFPACPITIIVEILKDLSENRGSIAECDNEFWLNFMHKARPVIFPILWVPEQYIQLINF
jgi:hypothetical protein